MFRPLNVLIGCEASGVIRDAFCERGHNAWSCDLLPTRSARTRALGKHFQCDVFGVLYYAWDIFIVHPDCTFLCSSGLHWNVRRPERALKTIAALSFVEALWVNTKHIPGVGLENPQGCINSRLPFMPRPQYIQPYDYGNDASKKTGLWLRGLPHLTPTKRFPGRVVYWQGKKVERWSNQSDSGQNNLSENDDRWWLRSESYTGIGDAMAEQWPKAWYASHCKVDGAVNSALLSAATC